MRDGTPDTTAKRLERQGIALFKEAFCIINADRGKKVAR